MTLLDLSDANVAFAKERADENGFKIKTICGDARFADKLINEKFDAVLLMGPMYHLLEQAGRIQAVNAALKLLKQSGIIFISFINMFSGMIYAMKIKPDIINDPTE